MKRFEYKTQSFTAHVASDLRDLNELGAAGWRVVCPVAGFHASNGETGTEELLLERQLPETDKDKVLG